MKLSEAAGVSSLKNSVSFSCWCTIFTIYFIEFISHVGSVEGAEALYVFGDSFVDIGNGADTMIVPYGMTWPGHPAGRASDGHIQPDVFADFFGLPSPTPHWQLKNDSQARMGVNFGRRGAGVTYAFGNTILDTQVDQLELLVERGVLLNIHMEKSVALISIGVNDYGSHSPDKVSNEANELEALVTNIVDGITLNVARLHGLGMRHIIVANLPDILCSPFMTAESNYSSCSSNTTFLDETLMHNALLQERVRVLNLELPGAHIVIIDQTKAFHLLFHRGSEFGFENTLRPCCTGIDDSHHCSDIDSEGKPLYKVCDDAGKFVIFDTIHPTEAAWKVVINLYASVEGFTQEGPKLQEWMEMYNV